jgi:hypothetical protein
VLTETRHQRYPEPIVSNPDIMLCVNMLSLCCETFYRFYLQTLRYFGCEKNILIKLPITSKVALDIKENQNIDV